MTTAAVADVAGAPASLPEPRIVTLEHPFADYLVTELRDRTTRMQKFNYYGELLTALLLAEVLREFPVQPRVVLTPLRKEDGSPQPADGSYLSCGVVIVKVLRAGDAMVAPIRRFFPDAPIGCIGTRRDEVTAEPHNYSCKLPPIPANDLVLVTDPMLATGGSAVDAIDRVKAAGATFVRFLCLFAAPEGVRKVNAKHPDVRIYGGVLDHRLNVNNFIVPGCGDFGDRSHGTVE